MGNFNNEIWGNSSNTETWNDCPECGKQWKDKFPTIGLIHRTRLCNECVEKIIDSIEHGQEKTH